MHKLIERLKFTFIYNLLFPVFQSIKTAEWYLKQKSTDTPHLIKQRIVKNYQEEHKTDILIETGTYLGMMVKAVKKNFSKIYTIELDKHLYKNAKQKFAGSGHIKVISGDSMEVLPKLLKKINQPVLFWLDAHYSKGITTKGSKNTPIMEELTAILNHKIKNHVILVDDAEVFNGKNDYPSKKYLKEYLLQNYPYLSMEITYNIIRITPKYLSQTDNR